MMFRIPATISRIPANTHQPLSEISSFMGNPFRGIGQAPNGTKISDRKDVRSGLGEGPGGTRLRNSRGGLASPTRSSEHRAQALVPWKLSPSGKLLHLGS